MKTLRRHLLLAALLGVGALMAPSQAQTNDDPALFTITAQDVGVEPSENGRDIGGRLLFGWARYHAGDDLAWADPAFDDADWEIASIGLQSDVLPRQGWPGVGWFRVRLRVDPSLRDHDLGFVIDHSGAVEVYLDGRRVYQSGIVGTTEADEEGRRDLNPFTLPLEAGREHVLALRYSSFVTQGFRTDWYYTGPGVYWGAWDTMMRHRAFVRFNQGVFTALFLAFALLFGLLYSLYRSERLFLYLALYYGFVALYAFVGGQLSFIRSPGLVMPLLDAFFACAATALLAMLLVLYAFFYPSRPRLFYGIAALGLAATVAVFIRLGYALFFFAFILVVHLEVLRVVGVALWRRKRWAWIVGLGIAPGILIQLWSQFEMLGLVATPWATSPFNPNMIGMLFFSCAFAVYVGMRFADAQQGLAELDAARRLQLAMLPDRVPEPPNVDVAASMQTASAVGGDYYDFDLADDGTLTVAIGDATGHGTEASIMVTAMKSLWNAFCSEDDLERVLQQAHVALKRMHLPKLYMAMALARLRGHTLELVGAGLPPALVYRAGTHTVEAVPLKGIPLGGPGYPRYPKRCVTLAPGDTVVLMTDGFPELFGHDGAMLGYDEAARVYADVADRSPAEIIEHFETTRRTWRNGHPPNDDITFVVLKMKARVAGPLLQHERLRARRESTAFPQGGRAEIAQDTASA